MAYQVLRKWFPVPDVVRYIMTFKESYEPMYNDLVRIEQMMTIHYYILFIVPKARAKFPDWRRYLLYNPFIQSYLLSRDFYE